MESPCLQIIVVKVGSKLMIEMTVNEGFETHLQDCASCRGHVVSDLRDIADRIERSDPQIPRGN
jgi:hypothetical protein